MNSLISIIIPIYKTEMYLNRCLDSVINQTYKNIEIILVDDGSPDSCGKICDEYAIKDSRIRVFHKENGGVSSARNLGILEANGEFIAFIDSDDYVELDFISYLYKLIKDYKVDMSICGYCFHDGERKQYTIGNENLLSKEAALKQLFYRTSYQGFLCNKLFSKKVITDNNLWLNESITICEDLLFVFQYMMCINQVIYGSLSKYHYVLNTNSAYYSRYTQQKFNSSTLTALKAYQIIERMIVESNLSKELYNILKARVVFYKVGLLRNMIETGYQNSYLQKKLHSDIRKDLLLFLKSDIEKLPRKIATISVACNLEIFGFLWRLSRFLRDNLVK